MGVDGLGGGWKILGFWESVAVKCGSIRHNYGKVWQCHTFIYLSKITKIED